MNVFNISGTEGPRGPDDKGGVSRSSSSSKSERSSNPGGVEDSFAQSGKAEKLEHLVEALRNGEAGRSELVDKFKALMELGELDTPAAAERAAEGMLSLIDDIA